MTFGRITRKQLNKSLRPEQRKAVRKIAKKVLDGSTELKYTDRSVVTSTYDFNGSVYNLTAIAGGPAEDQRVGEQVTVKSIDIQWLAFASTIGLANNQFLRLVVFRDNFADGNIPAMSAVLDSTGSEKIIYSNNNIDYHKRFTILRSVAIPLSTTEAGKVGKMRLRLNHKVYYTGALNSDEGKGQIYLGLMSNVNAQMPEVGFSSRVKFADN